MLFLSVLPGQPTLYTVSRIPMSISIEAVEIPSYAHKHISTERTTLPKQDVNLISIGLRNTGIHFLPPLVPINHSF